MIVPEFILVYVLGLIIFAKLAFDSAIEEVTPQYPKVPTWKIIVLIIVGLIWPIAFVVLTCNAMYARFYQR